MDTLRIIRRDPPIACCGVIVRYPELQYDGLNELEEVWMLSDGFLIAEAEIVALRMIIRGLTLVFEHIPGFRRVGSINPGFINILDHNQSKLGLTLLLQSLGKDEQVSESLR